MTPQILPKNECFVFVTLEGTRVIHTTVPPYTCALRTEGRGRGEGVWKLIGTR